MLFLLIIVLLIFAFVIYKLLKQLTHSLKAPNTGHNKSYKFFSAVCFVVTALILGFYEFALHRQEAWACGGETTANSWKYITFIAGLLLWTGFTVLLRQGRPLPTKKLLVVIIGSLFLTATVFLIVGFLSFSWANCGGW